MYISPWAKLTTSMIPKISVSPEATRARIMPLTIPLTTWMIRSSQGTATSDPQVLVDDRLIGAQRGGRRVVAHHALLHEVDPVGHRQGQRHVLLHQQDRHAVAVEHVDDLADLRHHPRHEPLGGLVEQD